MTSDPQPVYDVVLSAHVDLERTLELLARDPSLIDARLPSTGEAPIEAAAHMGRADIVRALLERGARPTLCALAVLGDVPGMTELLAGDSEAAQRPGAHGIPLLFHAALSRGPAALEWAWQAGARSGLNVALHAAVKNNDEDVLRWLLDHGARPVTGDHEGVLPITRAQQAGHHKLVTLMEAVGSE